MDDDTHTSDQITISIRKAYCIAFLLLVPMILLFGIPYFLIWNEKINRYLHLLIFNIKSDWSSIFLYLGALRNLLLFSLVVIAGAVLHELLHGIVWIIYLRKGFGVLKFGITSTDMSPYVHCTELLPVWVYRAGIVLPGIVLGIIPVLVGTITGKGIIFITGFFFTWAASGDFIIFWLIRHLEKNKKVLDHPELIGCIIYE